MPNVKSAMKRVKITARQNLRNRMIRSGVKTAIKKYEAGVAQGSVDETLRKTAISQVDKAASKGVIHKNVANRKKAQLSRQASV